VRYCVHHSVYQGYWLQEGGRRELPAESCEAGARILGSGGEPLLVGLLLRRLICALSSGIAHAYASYMHARVCAAELAP
jgi:hypothetical protein